MDCHYFFGPGNAFFVTFTNCHEIWFSLRTDSFSVVAGDAKGPDAGAGRTHEDPAGSGQGG
jgi:hypothetical protein